MHWDLREKMWQHGWAGEHVACQSWRLRTWAISAPGTNHKTPSSVLWAQRQAGFWQDSLHLMSEWEGVQNAAAGNSGPGWGFSPPACCVLPRADFFSHLFSPSLINLECCYFIPAQFFVQDKKNLERAPEKSTAPQYPANRSSLILG